MYSSDCCSAMFKVVPFDVGVKAISRMMSLTSSQCKLSIMLVAKEEVVLSRNLCNVLYIFFKAI